MDEVLQRPTGQADAAAKPSDTVMAHYYRAEMARMMSWRDRLDRTTNWAITVVAALLSVSLSTPTAHHGVLLFAMLLISLLLYVEARRYRFYDVYRLRVRQFERHYFAPLFTASEPAGDAWLQMLAQDLRHPHFRVGMDVAITRRLRRNYVWMYVILVLAWVLKITSPKLQEEGVSADTARPLMRIVGNAALGPLPGWLVMAVVASLLAVVLVFALRRRIRADDDEVHV